MGKEAEIKRLFEENHTIDEICEATGEDKEIVEERVERLKQKRRINNSKTQRAINIEKKIIELHKQTCTIGKIAKEVGLDEESVRKRIKKLKKEGKIETNTYDKKTKQTNKISMQHEKKANSVKTEKKEENKKTHIEINYEEIDNLLEELNNTKENVKIIKKYIEDEKKKYKKDDFEESNIKRLENAIEYLYDEASFNEITFIIKVKIHFMQYDSCIKFINSILTIKDWKKEEKDTFMKYKNFIKNEIKKLRIIELLKDGNSVESVANSTGMLKIDIIELNNKYVKESER